MMVITKIEPQKKHKNRISVFLDDEFAFGLNDFDVKRLRLKTGMNLTVEELEHIKSEVIAQEAKNYALKLLDRCAYTEQALTRKLHDRSYDNASIQYTVNFLKEYGYINDEEYTKRYVASALSSGKSGIHKIRYDLAGKGISAEIIELVMSEFEEESRENQISALKTLMDKKLKGDYSFPNIMKAKRYAFSRGFSKEAIDTVMHNLQKDDDFIE